MNLWDTDMYSLKLGGWSQIFFIFNLCSYHFPPLILYVLKWLILRMYIPQRCFFWSCSCRWLRHRSGADVFEGMKHWADKARSSSRTNMENSWKFQSPSEIERWWKGKEIAPIFFSEVVVKICDTQISVRHHEKFAFDISGLLLVRKNHSKKSFRNVNSFPLLHISTAMWNRHVQEELHLQMVDFPLSS